MGIQHWRERPRDLPFRLMRVIVRRLIDANRFRLGYSYDLTWGGRQIYAFDPSAAPGVRLQYQNHSFYAFAGVKTALLYATRDLGSDVTHREYEGEDHVGVVFAAQADACGILLDHLDA